MKRFIPFAFALLFSAFYCSSFAQTNALINAQWLLGKWENQTQRGKMVEEWARINDSTYSGRSYIITATDSVSLESIVLKKEGSEFFYIPTVKGQNNEQPVKFKLTAATEKALTFENPAHDFPQKITYTLVDEKSLIAEISGIVNGVERKRPFPMRKL